MGRAAESEDGVSIGKRTMKCPVCEGTGTEHHPGNIITGWCSLCDGSGKIMLQEWEQVEQALVEERAEEEAEWREMNGAMP